jgi:hypothetical protein
VIYKPRARGGPGLRWAAAPQTTTNINKGKHLIFPALKADFPYHNNKLLWVILHFKKQYAGIWTKCVFSNVSLFPPLSVNIVQTLFLLSIFEYLCNSTENCNNLRQRHYYISYKMLRC